MTFESAVPNAFKLTDVSRFAIDSALSIPKPDGYHQLAVPFAWLLEFRRNPSILFCGSNFYNALIPLISCCLKKGEKPIVVQASRQTECPGPEAHFDLTSTSVETDFLDLFRGYIEKNRVDLVLLDCGLVNYLLLSDIRLMLARDGVIILSLPKEAELRVKQLEVLEKFVGDKKIDYVQLSDSCYAVFVLSWNVRLDFDTNEPSGLGVKQDLALAVIARNEEKCIGNMIRSVAPLIGFAALLDTGSTDGTVAAACEVLKSSGVDTTIGHEQFTSFAEARNKCLAMVPTSIKWVLMLDADEEIRSMDFERLCALLVASDYDAWALPRVNWADGLFERSPSYPDRQLRLFRNGRNIHFEGSVHERLVGYRKLGRPPLNISFSGQKGGPHIHHLNTFYLTKEQLEAKRIWYKQLAEKGM